MGTARPSVLWQLRSPDGSPTECLLAELETGDLDVAVVTSGQRNESQTFDNPVAALEWALAQEDRLICAGWCRYDA
jgi:hypothetical protein